MVSFQSDIAFRDQVRAAGKLVTLSEKLGPATVQKLRVLLRAAPDADAALGYLVRLDEANPAALQRIVRSPAALQFLVTVFAYSRFLSEEVLQHPEWIESLPQAGDLHRVITAEEYGKRLEARLAPLPLEDSPSAQLSAFRREQMLRILIRDILAYGTLADITAEISNLADAIVETTRARIRAGLVARFGEPRCGDGGSSALTVLALGKLGGQELNYSSDIDLMFLYTGNGETDGTESISNKEFFKKLCVRLTDWLSAYTPHGACYRVDLRLRPEGTLGEIALSIDGAREYYRSRARDWELQMLIKARVCAGDRQLGREMLEFIQPLTYSTTLDFSKVEAVSEARMRIHEKLAKRRGKKDEFDIKLAPGGIRDIEFLVQCLQRLHGGREPWVRHSGTLMALFRLWDKKLLSEREYGRLASAYRLFRNVEHRLQFLDDRQTHTLPEDTDELELLARRLPAVQLGADNTAELVHAAIERHLSAVKEIYERVVHLQLPLHYAPLSAPATPQLIPEDKATPAPDDAVSINLARAIEQRAPGLAATLAQPMSLLGRKAFESFLEQALERNPEWLEWLNDDRILAGYAIDLFEHSPYLGELLDRKPELIEELRQMRERPGSRVKYGEMPPLLAGPGDVRRFFTREMLRIQAESICLRTPIFDTLHRTSDLTDCIISTVYALAVDYVASNRGPAKADYQQSDQLMVIALGRLGMQEFDLGSDADLVFVLPEADADEMVFWTRVAERIVAVLTGYTADGTLFAVDTRLRPNGGDGPLVRTDASFKEYFSKAAEAWEGIAYMKARAVGGNLAAGTEFLSELQALDWRRYGQSGRSKSQLRQMRIRLEKEQGPENPLKAGRGGYYDIDFALMYLRLKSAGIFFPVLNTPARIDVIEKMGHLERADAEFLRDAATFYRAVDHAMRLSTGHSQGNLPAAQMQLDVISDLVGRWTDDHLHDQPLADELAQIEKRTREYFDRLFGAS
ncbi:MAG: glutamine-synthetase adenylyltransferase [Bryobacteraceae bacterium]